MILCQPLGHEGKAEVHFLQAQADGVCCAAVQAGKGVYAGGADGEQVGFDFGGGFGFRRVVGYYAVIQDEAFGALFKGEAAGDLQEAEGVKLQVGAGAKQAPLTAVHGEGCGAADAGGDVQGGFAGAGGAGDVAVVDYGVADFFSAVDFDADGVGTGGEAVDADEGGAGGAGLQARPVADGSAGGDLLGCQFFTEEGKAEVDAG